LFPLFGCYLVLWLALTPRLPVIPAARFGDLSYGIYIYGWPVEQGVIWLLGGRAVWWQVFLLALPTAAALAFLSWHLVESPALRLKPKTRRSPMTHRRDAGVEVSPAVSMASTGQI
jgi:peptidoglycan/LPS O-acetylase OafA/YrhL